MGSELSTNSSDLTEQKITQYSYLHEPAALRLVNPDNPEDLEILEKIDHDPNGIWWFESIPDNYVYAGGTQTGALRFVPDPDKNLGENLPEEYLYTPMDRGELTRFAQGFDREGHHHVLFAVSGSPDYVEPSEVGKIQGWIRIFEDKEERIKQMKDLGLLPGYEQNPYKVYVLEYKKRKDAAPHQMASGLRQACLRFMEMVSGGFTEEHTEQSIDRPYKLGTWQQRSDIFPQRVKLVAYLIDRQAPAEQNTASLRVLESAGFERCPVGIRYDEIAERPDILYILNPEKLYTQVDKKNWEDKLKKDDDI